MSIMHQTHHCGCNCWYGFAWPAFVEVEINQEANTYKILSCKLPTGALETEQVVRDRFVKNWREYRVALEANAKPVGESTLDERISIAREALGIA